MTARDDKVETFRAHHEGDCFIMPNPWGAMVARMLSGLGFEALATSSSGYAFSIGRRDGAAHPGGLYPLSGTPFRVIKV